MKNRLKISLADDFINRKFVLQVQIRRSGREHGY